MKDNNKMNQYALILAGGKGTRLWPISTAHKPKQYLNLYDDKIMINETIKRIEPLFDYENIFVIVNKEQEEIANRYIDYNIPRENIILEPQAKNTAMGIFYASLKIAEKRGNGIMTILSSDHYIKQEEKLLSSIKEGIEVANKDDSLVIVGIKPTYPATGFGYIKYCYNKEEKCNIVQEFIEKPNHDTALIYFKSKKYYWNSGIYIWEIQTILKNFKMFLPKIYKYKDVIKKNIDNFDEIAKVYNQVQAISISNGILEKSNDIKMIKGEFEWIDIGSINDFFKVKKKDEKYNVELGNTMTLETQNTNIYNDSQKFLIATLGVNNLNIINCNNVILVANKRYMDELSEMMGKINQTEDLSKYL